MYAYAFHFGRGRCRETRTVPETDWCLGCCIVQRLMLRDTLLTEPVRDTQLTLVHQHRDILSEVQASCSLSLSLSLSHFYRFFFAIHFFILLSPFIPFTSLPCLRCRPFLKKTNRLLLLFKVRNRAPSSLGNTIRLLILLLSLYFI